MKASHRVLILLIMAAILSCGWWLPMNPQWGFSICPLKNLTGWDCMGCGLTRSFQSMSQGHLARAFLFNAAGPLLYAFTCLYFLEQLKGLLATLLGKSWPALGRAWIDWPQWMVRCSLIVFVVLLVGHWIIRLQHQI